MTVSIWENSGETTKNTFFMKSKIQKLLTGSPSLEDGFNGARDAAIFERYDYDPEIGAAHVQVVSGTKDLLRRAGINKARMGTFRAVPVARDDFGRLQIAPPLPLAHSLQPSTFNSQLSTFQ